MSNVQKLSFDNVDVIEFNEQGKGTKRKQPTQGKQVTNNNNDKGNNKPQHKSKDGNNNNNNKPNNNNNKPNNNKKKGKGGNNQKKDNNNDEEEEDDGLGDLTPEQLVQRYRQNKRQEEQIRKSEEDALIKSSKYAATVEKVEAIDTRNIKHNLQRHKIQNVKRAAKEAAIENIYADEFLLPTKAGGVEINDDRKILTTRHLKQKDLLEDASETVKRKAIHLQGLEYGPYQSAYTNNGKYMLLVGERGHVTNIDWRGGKVLHEHQVREQIFDCTYLQDHTIYALARRNNLSIYDREGIEVHSLKVESTAFPRKLDFLPYHFLLVCGTQQGFISYRDVSTGDLVSSKRTKKGPVLALRQNPQNAVMAAGHGGGLVTMWTPNMNDAVVTMKVHENGGALTDLAIDESGRYMCSTGTDGYLKLWDIRNYKEVCKVRQFAAPTTLDISHNGMIALGIKGNLSVYKLDQLHQAAFDREQEPNAKEYKSDFQPYMTEPFPANNVNKVRFVPYEDLLGVGLNGQYRQCIIPGAGAANFDSWAANPFENKDQRRERVVKSLLEKLQPDMITLDSHIFNVMDKNLAKEEKTRQIKTWNESFKHDVDLEKDRARDNIQKREKRKKHQIVQEKQEKFEDYITRKRQEEREKREQQKEEAKKAPGEKVVRSALDRFL